MLFCGFVTIGSRISRIVVTLFIFTSNHYFYWFQSTTNLFVILFFITSNENLVNITEMFITDEFGLEIATYLQRSKASLLLGTLCIVRKAPVSETNSSVINVSVKLF